ncbi:unnamed protein product, partial [Dovyalis caffra]
VRIDDVDLINLIVPCLGQYDRSKTGFACNVAKLFTTDATPSAGKSYATRPEPAFRSRLIGCAANMTIRKLVFAFDVIELSTTDAIPSAW